MCIEAEKRVKALSYFLNQTEQILECRNFRDSTGAMLLHPIRLRKFDPNADIKVMIETAKVKRFKETQNISFIVYGDEAF